MSKTISYLAMVCGGIASVLFGILAALYPIGNTHLYLCIGVTCMEFIFIRFNLLALRNDQADRLLIVNNAAFLILIASAAYFIRIVIGGFPMWIDIADRRQSWRKQWDIWNYKKTKVWPF